MPARLQLPEERLAIRPVWHQRQDRVLAPILVCFLAYVLWKTLEQWQSRAGLGNSPRTVLQELAAINSTDIVPPAAGTPATSCDCAVSFVPTALKQRCSSASAYACPNGSACPSRHPKWSANSGP